MGEGEKESTVSCCLVSPSPILPFSHSSLDDAHLRNMINSPIAMQPIEIWMIRVRDGFLRLKAIGPSACAMAGGDAGGSACPARHGR